MRFRILAAVLAALLVCGCSRGAEEKPLTPQALIERAGAGDARARCALGLLYLRGQGVEQSDAEAARWIRLAADQGLASAQYELARMYEQGRGVPGDEPWEALRWLFAAARQGHALAQLELGRVYLAGKGAEPDPAEAAKWLEQAAAQGQAEAQTLLAGLYLSGEGVARDGARAGHWFRAAAEQGDPKAMYELGRIFAGGRLAPQDLAEAYMWFTLAAERGQEEARLALEQLNRNLDEKVRGEALGLAERWRRAAPGR